MDTFDGIEFEDSPDENFKGDMLGKDDMLGVNNGSKLLIKNAFIKRKRKRIHLKLTKKPNRNNIIKIFHTEIVNNNSSFEDIVNKQIIESNQLNSSNLEVSNNDIHLHANVNMKMDICTNEESKIRTPEHVSSIFDNNTNKDDGNSFSSANSDPSVRMDYVIEDGGEK